MSEAVTIEVEPEESSEPEVVVVADSGSDDAVMDATTIDLVTRVTRCEDAIATLASVVEAQSEQIAALSVVEEVQQAEIEAVAEEVEEVAEASADAMEEIAEEVVEASPEIEPEEVPSSREHFFFRKWGNRD
jgi:hypothetical protein